MAQTWVFSYISLQVLSENLCGQMMNDICIVWLYQIAYGWTLRWWDRQNPSSGEPVPVSSSVALCEVINLPMPGVFVCERYELMVISVGWNVKVIRLLPEMSLIALRVNFPEHFSSPQTLSPRSHSAILTEWSSPVSFPFLWPFLHRSSVGRERLLWR